MRSPLRTTKRPLSTAIRQGLTALAFTTTCGQLAGQQAFSNAFYYADRGNGEVRSLRLANGSFILYGGNIAPFDGDIALVEESGQMVWDKQLRFPGTSNNGVMVRSAFQDSEGMIVLGVSGGYLPDNGGVIRMDPEGNVLWSLVMGRPIEQVIELADGDYAAFGGAFAGPETERIRPHYHRISPAGAVLADARYNMNGEVPGTPDTHYAALDMTEASDSSVYAFFYMNDHYLLMHLDTDGNVLWVKDLLLPFHPGTFEQWWSYGHPWRLFTEADGSVMLLGKEGVGETFLVYIHASATGEVQAATRLDPPSGGAWAADAFAMPDGSFLVYAILNAPGYDRALMHIGPHGAFLDAEILPRPENGYHAGCSLHPDGTLDMFTAVDAFSDPLRPLGMEHMLPPYAPMCGPAGSALSFTQTALNVQGLMLQTVAVLPYGTMEAGPFQLTPRSPATRAVCTSTGIRARETGADMRLYPAPATDQVHLDGVAPERIVDIGVRDGSGRLVPVPREGTVLDLSALSPGVYICTVIERNGTLHTARVVRE